MIKKNNNKIQQIKKKLEFLFSISKKSNNAANGMQAKK